jgi:hypothetical protein
MSLLEDFLDGLIDDEASAAVRAHLGECEACAGECEALVSLRARVEALPESIEPPKDLWPEIEARIAAEKVVRARFGRSAMMAAAAVVVLVSSVVTAFLVGRHSISTVAVSPTPRPAASDVLQASFAELGVYDYQSTRQQLLDVLEARQDEFSPATLEVILSSLRLIDDALGEISRALGDDPGNELLMRQLASTYRRQINLLERAANLPPEV